MGGPPRRDATVQHGPMAPESSFGSYFISTYPPFSCWNEGRLERFGEVVRGAPSARPATLGLYVHIPFCVQRCPYCYYLSHDDRPEEINRYLDALARELEAYAEQPYLAGRKPGFVYFGGGTPSLLSVTRIRDLVGRLQRALPWTEAREVSFECAPKSVTPDKLRLLRELGVTRISLGAQQLDDRVLRASGRVHLAEDFERAYEAANSVAFDVVNVDLMVGLPGETEETFRTSLERVIELGPASVTIYQLEIPLNTPLYRSLRDGTAAEIPASWDTKRDRLRWAFERLESEGYTVRSAYAAVRDPARHVFAYQDEQYRGADLLGIGVSSFSYLAGVHHQNPVSISDYVGQVANGLPRGRAYALNDEERLVREFVLQLKLGGVETSYFRDKFGVDPADRFAGPLERCIREGWATSDPEGVHVTREGLLRIDRLIPDFYLPEHRGIRYS